MKKLNVYFLILSSAALVTTSAFANCRTNPHGFDCQLDVLEGDDAGGRVVPNIAFPEGTKKWNANLFVNGPKTRVNPPIQTIVQTGRHIRTCGIQLNGRGGMSITTKVQSNQITVTLKNFRGGKSLSYSGEIVNSLAEAQLKQGLFGSKSVFEIIQCSIFNRVGNAHLSCALFAVSDTELVPLGIIGGLSGPNPKQCTTNPTSLVVL